VTVREEGKGETVVTTPGRLVYHSRVVDAYHVILDPREGTLIFLNHYLVFTLYHLASKLRSSRDYVGAKS
jgi:hypothetical protein